MRKKKDFNKQKSVGESRFKDLKPSDIIFKPQWAYSNPENGYVYTLGVIPGNLLYLSIQNYPENISDVDACIDLLNRVLDQNQLVNIPWIVTDISKMKDAGGMKLRNHYLRALRKLNDQYQNNKATLFIIGATRTNRIVVRLMSVFLKQKLIFADSLSEVFQNLRSLNGIRISRDDQHSEFLVKSKDLEELTYAFGSLLLDGEEQSFPASISGANPLSGFAEILQQVRNDLNELRENERQAATRQLEESERHRSILASTVEELKDARKKLQEMYYNLQVAEEETRAANMELMATTDSLRDNNQALESEKEKVKETHEMLLSITENAFDGVFLLQGNEYVYCNKRLAEITGYTKEQISNPEFGFLRMLTPISQTVLKTTISAHKPGETFSTTLDLQLVSKNKDIKIVELNLVSPGLPHNVPMIIGIVRDITLQKQAEAEAELKDQLERKVAIAEESLKFKQNFLANMSHEIRSPLTGILGMIEILHESGLTPQQYEYIKVIQQSGESLRGIVNDVLDFSKIEAGKLTLNKKQFRISGITRRAENLFHALCKKPISFENIISNDLPDYIEADENRIMQIVTNFISNAVKFTEQGKIQLRTEVLRKTTEDNSIAIKISVSDTGIGIGKQKRSQLFQPFSQIETTDTRKVDGTGLGLVISKELAEMHGGNIGVESEPGEGSTFWFTFETTILDTIDQKDIYHRATEYDKLNKELQILLVEDRVVNQKVIKLMLSSMGHKVTIAENGRQAIEKYKPHKFDLIFMDIQMPVMDGISATKELREKHEYLPPIVGLSANAFEGDREKYMAQGLDEYVTKPVRKDDFLFLMERLEINKQA